MSYFLFLNNYIISPITNPLVVAKLDTISNKDKDTVGVSKLCTHELNVRTISVCIHNFDIFVAGYNPLIVGISEIYLPRHQFNRGYAIGRRISMFNKNTGYVVVKQSTTY